MARKQADNHYDLDLTEFVEPIRVRIGEYAFTLPADLTIRAMVMTSDLFQDIGKMAVGEEKDLTKLGEEEERIWELLEEILARAEPPPPSPIRELLTTQAAIKLLSFLLSIFNRAILPGRVTT